MRTAVIDEACERFRSTLQAWVPPGCGVETPRIAFDSAGQHIRALVRRTDGTLDLLLTFHPRTGFAVGWGGERAFVERWRPELPADLDAPRRAAAEALLDAVRPIRHPLTALEPQALASALGGEGACLAPAFEAFASHYGESMGALALDGDSVPSVAYPHVTDQEVLLYAPPPFREDAHVAAYLEDLGFAVDRHHRVFAVPLPSSFQRRLRRLGVQGGLRPELRPLRATLFSAEGWLREIAAGVFPINVDGLVSRVLGTFGARVAVHRSQREKLHTHFHALGHDMGIHTLAMHRVPRGRMRELRRLASVALARGGRAPKRAADFFEERLTRACVDTWASASDVDAFARDFETRFPTLAAELGRAAYA